MKLNCAQQQRARQRAAARRQVRRCFVEKQRRLASGAALSAAAECDQLAVLQLKLSLSSHLESTEVGISFSFVEVNNVGVVGVRWAAAHPAGRRRPS